MINQFIVVYNQNVEIIVLLLSTRRLKLETIIFLIQFSFCLKFTILLSLYSQ